VIRHPNAERQQQLTRASRHLVRRSLELIRDHSTLNVRILTGSPLAKSDFELFKSFGKRLAFGMSIPTLRNDLAKIYEPKAPAPSQRYATLKAAKEFGLHIYVAVAPTYPECDKSDLEATLSQLSTSSFVSANAVAFTVPNFVAISVAFPRALSSSEKLIACASHWNNQPPGRIHSHVLSPDRFLQWHNRL
jgi:DNA repair photolyase